MPLFINTNLASLQAQFNLSQTSNSLNTSLERLSSGLQINSAADNPAGLVVSQEQAAQISGLNAAITNTSVASNMIQTADGALQEVNNLLAQIRGLAVSSSNSGANDPTAIAANQAQITNALATINSIAQNTQFGNEFLLNGSLAGGTTGTDAVGNNNIVSQNTAGLANQNLALGSYHIYVTQAYVPAAAAVPATVTGGLTVNSGTAGTFFNTLTGGTGSAVNANAVTGADFFTEAGSVVLGNTNFAYTSATTVQSALNYLNANSNYNVTLNNGQFTVTAKTAGAAGNGAQLLILGATDTASLAPTANGANTVAEQDPTAELTQISGGNPTGTAIQLTAQPGSGTLLQNAALGISFYLTPTAAESTGDKGNAYTVSSSGNGALFQIGANAGQTASISIGSAETNAIGTGVTNTSNFANLSQINVTTFQGAQDSINVINQAISQVSTLRANLGAFLANTLEASANSLQNALTNTTAAQATIQDTNFASETANFTQQQVLMQAGTQVLSNANQIPGLVVQLLQGH